MFVRGAWSFKQVHSQSIVTNVDPYLYQLIRSGSRVRSRVEKDPGGLGVNTGCKFNVSVSRS